MMKFQNSQRNSNLLLILGFIFFLLSSHTVTADSRRPLADVEIRRKKQACYADIESGSSGWQCKSSDIEKENCALRCLSPTCYDLVYSSDPLEEGEKDLVRSEKYKYCMYKMRNNEQETGTKEREIGNENVTGQGMRNCCLLAGCFWGRVWRVLRAPLTTDVCLFSQDLYNHCVKL